MKLTKKSLLAGLMTVALSLVMVLPLAVGATNFEIPTVNDLNTNLGSNSLTQIIQSGLTIFFSLLGIIAVLIILYAGFKWMTAQGDADKVKDAKQMIYQAVAGLIIVFAALAITNFVIGALQNATGGNPIENTGTE